MRSSPPAPRKRLWQGERDKRAGYEAEKVKVEEALERLPA
jgi:hypothetical protein